MKKSGEDVFSLDSRLGNDCHVLGSFPLCRLLVMNDASYPWFILVPQRPELREIYQLSRTEQHQLLAESSHLGRHLVQQLAADKLNVAALGNMVSQLHIHHIVRYHDDPAWPAPVWGHAAAVPYCTDDLSQLKERLLPGLGEGFIPE